jgi:hypothetical protein
MAHYEFECTIDGDSHSKQTFAKHDRQPKVGQLIGSVHIKTGNKSWLTEVSPDHW